jgi:Zn finger protein HypA/HybF involved in hydrogenase expression
MKKVTTDGVPCPHCQAGEPSVWDGELFHYAHPDGVKLKMCHYPWRARCLHCSADVTQSKGGE